MKKKSKNLNLRIEPALLRALQEAAASAHQPVSWFVRDALLAYLPKNVRTRIDMTNGRV